MVFRKENMINNNTIKENNRDIRDIKLFKIIIRLYLTYSNIPGYLVARIIHSKAYISHEDALSYPWVNF